MQRITFHNDQNGLEYTFATDTPRALLVAFDGNSLAAEFTQYKPIWFEGVRTKAHTFNGRTITMTVNWSVIEDGKICREAACAEWDKIQSVFAPGYEGTLTWTNGIETRTITCYANETPRPREKVRGLFSADFTLTADYPFWLGTTEHSKTITHSVDYAGSFHNVVNDCPIIVYPLIKSACALGTGGGYTIVWQAPENPLEFDKKMQDRAITINYSSGLANSSPIYIDNQKRCVYQYSGSSIVNKTSYLSPPSSFFGLLPGDNNIVLAGSNFGGLLTVTFSWFDHYLGVPL